jgi:hypothetical protein
MKSENLKVFHGLVNYGTQAGLFAKKLRENGINALSVVYPDMFIRQTDVELLFGGNFIQKVLKHSWNWIRRFYWFFKFNTFHFYYGTTLFPFQLDLPFYRLLNKIVIMEYFGFDVQNYKISVRKYGDRTNIAYMGKQGVKHDIKIEKRYNFESRYIDLKLVGAPCVSEFVPDSIVIPLAINVTDYTYSLKTPADRIKILHAPTHKGNKGTIYITRAIERLISEGFPIGFVLAENLSHSELKNKYIECDIFVDQVLAGWYGTAAVEAMALGRPTVCFLREEYYTYVDFSPKLPIINADQDNIYEVLKELIINKEKLPAIGLKSRQFVEEIHNLQKITCSLIHTYLEVWEKS